MTVTENFRFLHILDMRNGNVLSYAPDVGLGVIKTSDGQNFIFVAEDWLSLDIKPKAGTSVTFEESGSMAKQIKIISLP